MELFHAKYQGLACKVRKVEDPRGDDIVTRRGNVHARQGDYVAVGVDEAPRGYHSQVMDRVIRQEDQALSIGDKYEPVRKPVKADNPLPPVLTDNGGVFGESAEKSDPASGQREGDE